MSRKITAEIVRAFENGETLSKSNTRTDGQAIYLHGNKIAEREDGELFISLAGWNTNTTRERLNGLRDVRLTTKQGQAYLNGKPITDDGWYKIDRE